MAAVHDWYLQRIFLQVRGIALDLELCEAFSHVTCNAFGAPISGKPKVKHSILRKYQVA